MLTAFAFMHLFQEYRMNDKKQKQYLAEEWPQVGRLSS